MRYNKKTLLLSAVTLGLLTTNLEPNIVNASPEADNDNGDLVVEEPLEDISKENGTTYHIVRKGETVFSISKKYDISEEALKFWNNISNNIIHVNQVLSVNGVNVYQDFIKETNQFTTTQQFINRVAPIALEVAGKYELYPSVMIAQAIHESASGTSELAVLANNYFGIKRTYKGMSIYKMSPEEVNGNFVNQSSRFRMYPNLYTSFEDNGKRLRLGPNVDSEEVPWNSYNYKDTWIENAYTYRDATQGLVNGGYATDSRYAAKLNNIIESYNLIEYDKQLYDFVEEREKNPVRPDNSDTSAVAAAASEFIKFSQALPNISEIKTMTAPELKDLQTQLVNLRAAYNSLSNEDKQHALVITWANYLQIKEDAVQDTFSKITPANRVVGQAFITAARKLPNLSEIEKMNADQLVALQAELVAARNLYSALPSADQANSEVARWEGYLSVKETKVNTLLVTGKDFTTAVRALPNVSTIEAMNASQLSELNGTLASTRALYNALPSSEKAKADIIRWEGYLTLKEETVENKQVSAIDRFVNAAKDLPFVSEIEEMNTAQLQTLQGEMAFVRGLYNALSSTDKANAEASTWEGFLSEKEAVVSKQLEVLAKSEIVDGFLVAAKALPNISEIEQMNTVQLENLQDEMASVRSLYKVYPSTPIANSEVARWEGYLSDKEAKVETLFSKNEEFLLAARALPKVSTIENMSANQLVALEDEMKAVRSLYNTLSSAMQKETDIARWEGHLSVKEEAVYDRLYATQKFIDAAKALPNIDAIEKMTNAQLKTLNNEIKAAKALHNSLTTKQKANAEVSKWNGYLSEKEKTLVVQLKVTEEQEAISKFLDAVDNAPSVSKIKQMTVREVRKLKEDLASIRSIYNNLTSTQKRDAEVIKWEGYLKVKESTITTMQASPEKFVNIVKALPSVSEIKRMNEKQLDNTAANLQYVRKSYDSLTPAAKSTSLVIKWEGYLTEKENAVFGVSSFVFNREFKYGVESGDTFNSIAEKFQVDLNALLKRNPKVDPTKLYAGQVLYIPYTVVRPMNHSQALDGKNVVYLDIGHGGNDPGASAFGIKEKDLNLNIGLKLTNRLKAMGYEVINVRTDDSSVSLIDRSKDANKTNADIFVSLHHNAYLGIGKGIETFYYKYSGYNPTINHQYHNDGARIANSVYLAHLIQDKLISATGAHYRRVDGETFSAIRETNIPAALIEFGFMDNPNEINKLLDGSYQNKMVNAVADAIDTYFKTLYN